MHSYLFVWLQLVKRGAWNAHGYGSRVLGDWVVKVLGYVFRGLGLEVQRRLERLRRLVSDVRLLCFVQGFKTKRLGGGRSHPYALGGSCTVAPVVCRTMCSTDLR